MIILYTIAAFLVGILTEVIWIMYIISSGKMTIEDKKGRVKTASFSAMTGVMTIVIAALTFLQGWWLSLIWIAGIWVGAFYSLNIEEWVFKNIIDFNQKS